MAIFHLHISVGKKGKNSAKSKYNYLMRLGKYADRDKLIYSEHQLPKFANSAKEFWSAADKHSRKNASLFREVEFALPIELNADQRQRLAVDYAKHIAKKFGEADAPLPFTLAIHSGNTTNPHCHVVFCEKPIRAEADYKTKHGTKRVKIDDYKSFFGNKNKKSKNFGRELGHVGKREFIDVARESWADFANQALQKAGRKERISHLSNQKLGLSAEPGKHVGARKLYGTPEYKRLASENKKAYQTLKDANKAAKDAKKLAKDDIYINQNSSLIVLLLRLFKLLFDEIPKLQHAQQIREAAERAERAAYMQQQYTKKALNDYKKSMLEVTPQPAPATRAEPKPEPVKPMNIFSSAQQIKEETKQPKPQPQLQPQSQPGLVKPKPKPAVAVEHEHDDDDDGLRM